MSFSNVDIAFITALARDMRWLLEHNYGSNMAGRCIEATDALLERYSIRGYKATAKRVWCLYEYFESCSNYCFEEHWLVEIVKGKEKCYVDITLDQFQWAFSRQLPGVYVSDKLPKFLLTRKPGKTILDKCGWNNWHNYGNYINNFEYY